MGTNLASSPKTLTGFLRDLADRFGDRPALLFKAGLRYRRWSYNDLWQDSGRLASVLQARGVAKGDRVLIWGPNCPQWVLALFGCMRIGAVVVPLDIRSSPEFVHGVAAQTRPSFLFVSRVTPAFHRELEIPEIDFEEFERLWYGLDPADPVDLDPDDLAEVMFTSGTTGDPKGVMLSHRNLLSNLESIRHHVPGKPSDRLVSILPLSHMFEQTCGLLMPLRSGANVTYPLSLKPTTLFKTLAERRVTLMLLVPQALDLFIRGIEREVSRQGKERLWRLMLRAARFVPFRLRKLLFRRVHQRFGSRLEYIFAGGAALDTDLGSKWAGMGIKIIQGYGATEASPVISSHTIRDPRYDSAGLPLPGVDVRIASDGEILARGPNMTRGYWEAPDQTAAVFEDGWYKTGDLGFFGKEGFLHINGRKKDMIVLANGQNVFPEDIEVVLLKHPDVEDAVVVGLPKGSDTEVHAVFRVEGQETARVATSWANGQLADHQQIRGFTVWPEEDFPRTHTLKVKKGLVLDAVMAGPSSKPQATQQEGDSEEERGLYHLIAEVAEVASATVTADQTLGSDLNLDSLGRVELLSLIEGELGVYLDETVVSPTTTVGELESLLESGAQATAEVPSFHRWPLTPWCAVVREALLLALAFPVFSVLHRSRVSGLEHLRRLEGPAIFAVNHNATRWDTFLLLKSLPREWRRRFTFAAAAEITFGTIWKGFLASVFVNASPLSRDTAIRASLEHMGRLLDGGWSIGIFPEGDQRVGEEMLPFQTGAGLLGVECWTPIVPVHVVSNGRQNGGLTILPRRETLSVRIGRPLRIPPGTSYEDATRAIEDAVRSL